MNSSENHFTRRMPVASEENINKTVNRDNIFEVAEAIGSKSRWELLEVIAEEPRTIDDLVDQVGLSKGTISVHISKLEEAGIVKSNYNISSEGGVKKEIAINVDEITLNISSL